MAITEKSYYINYMAFTSTACGYVLCMHVKVLKYACFFYSSKTATLQNATVGQAFEVKLLNTNIKKSRNIIGTISPPQKKRCIGELS